MAGRGRTRVVTGEVTGRETKGGAPGKGGSVWSQGGGRGRGRHRGKGRRLDTE